jgi:rare lipoprotein A
MLIPAQRNLPLALPALALLLATILAGCGGRHIAANPRSSTNAPGESAPSVSPTSNPPGRSSPSNSRRATPRPSEVPVGGFEQGLASWYGVPFNGRRSANGEIYDMYKFTAAHRTLPFDTVVRVTNLDNGMQTEVRITDRGPFVEDRIIDLSLAAARAIGMVGTGTARVKLDIIASDAANFAEPVHASASANSLPPSASPPSVSQQSNRPTINSASPPITSATSAPADRSALSINEGYFTVQVGAFGARENAEQLKRSLESRYHPVMIQDFLGPNGHLYRVRVGNFQSEDAARGLAEKLAAENGLRPMVVRQDEIAPHGDDRQ